MLSKMATGRSYNVIAWLRKALPYTMLVSMANNHYLPYVINEGACELLRVLYLDCYPQVTTQFSVIREHGCG